MLPASHKLLPLLWTRKKIGKAIKSLQLIVCSLPNSEGLCVVWEMWCATTCQHLSCQRIVWHETANKSEIRAQLGLTFHLTRWRIGIWNKIKWQKQTHRREFLLWDVKLSKRCLWLCVEIILKKRELASKMPDFAFFKTVTATWV